MSETDKLEASAMPVSWRTIPGPAAVAVIAALVLLPLVLTPVLPLTDFYAHLVRYHVLATIDASPALRENFAPAWALLPNLGLDILGTALMALFPPLLAAKILGALIMGLPALGALALAHVLHGRIGVPALILASFLTVNHIVIWGFSNFLVGLGLALLGIALWLRLAGRPALQLAAGAAFAVLILFVHGLTFALWGLMLGAVELAREVRLGGWAPRHLLVRMGRLALLAVVPALLFLQMPTAGSDDGVTVAFSNLSNHIAAGRGVAEVLDEIAQRIDGVLRVVEAGWPAFDLPIGATLWLLIAAGMATGALRLHPDLRLAAAGILALVAVMPPNLFGVGHLDERTPVVLLAVLAAGLSAEGGDGRARAAILACLALLLALRTVVVGVAWAESGARYTDFRVALGELDGKSRLGGSVFLDGTDAPGLVWPHCKPLVFLMYFDAGIIVPTFANPTQQPLAIRGPLANTRQRRAEGLSDEGGLRDKLAREAEAGIDFVVVCTDGPHGSAPESARLVAAEPPWALYELTPEADGASRP